MTEYPITGRKFQHIDSGLTKAQEQTECALGADVPVPLPYVLQAYSRHAE